MANIHHVCYEANEVLNDLGLKFHHDYLGRDDYTAWYSVNGCDELLEIDEFSFKFNGIDVDFYDLPNVDKKSNQVISAKTIKLYIQEYVKKRAEQDIGAYI